MPHPDSSTDAPPGRPTPAAGALDQTLPLPDDRGAPLAPDQTPTERLRPRTEKRLGHYALLSVLGRGGMGAVWEAIDTRLDRPVALKVMLGDRDASPLAVERFKREALHAARLRHPNIVQVHDVGHEDGRHFLVIDLVHGEPLDAAMRRGPISYRDQAQLLVVVAGAVQYAHEQGVVHRDLKPGNIMLERGGGSGSTAGRSAESTIVPQAGALGVPLVMDFGLAKDTERDSGLSRSGDAMGTPSYMPPEQAEGRNREVGPPSDVYSLGAILYEMLTGRPPFVGESAVQVMRALVADDPVPPREISPAVPRDLETICMKCLEKRPERRYASAVALAADLRAWLAGDPIAARASTGLERALRRVRKNPAAYGIAAAAALVIALGSAAFMRSLQRQASDADAARAAAEHALADHQAAEAARIAAERAATAMRAQAEAESHRSWHLLVADDFSDPAVASRWKLLGGDSAVVDGELRFTSKRPTYAILAQPVVGDVAIEYDCRLSGRVLDDVSCFLRASPPRPDLPVAFSADTGYAFKFGCYRNTKNMLLRDGRPLWEERASPLTDGRTVHVRAEQIGDRLILTVDSQVVCDVRDPTPILDGSRNAIGLSCYWSEAAFDNVRVYVLRASLREDLLGVAQRHLQMGNVVTARDLFADVRDAATEPERRAVAERGLGQAQRLVDGIAQRETVARVLAQAYPEATPVVTAMADGIHVTMDGATITDLTPIAGLPISRLSLAGQPVSDLSPLRGMPLTRLVISRTRVQDLGPLAGMPLDELEMEHLRRVGDRPVSLEPLRGMPLRLLACSDAGVSDLAPLSGSAIERLSCAHNAIESLEPLAGMRSLTLVVADGNRIASLEPLRGVALTYLTCGANPIRDLEPLRGKALNTLSIRGCGLGSLESLRGMPLQSLDCAENAIASLEPLRGMPLSLLSCSGNPLGTLAPIAGMGLNDLRCDRCDLDTLEPLRGMPLKYLHCAGNRIASLEPLSRSPLASLSCARNRLDSLHGLEGSELVSVNCAGNAITSLEPLRDLPMAGTAQLDANRIASLAPLAGKPLLLLSATGNPLTSFEPLAPHPPWSLCVDADLLATPESRRIVDGWAAGTRAQARTAVQLRQRLAHQLLARAERSARDGDFTSAFAAGRSAARIHEQLGPAPATVIEAPRRWASLARLSARAGAARQTLSADPGAPAAQLAIARHLLACGRFDEALPALAAGPDPAQSGLASLELARDRTAVTALRLAQGWSAAARDEAEPLVAQALADRAWRWCDRSLAAEPGAPVPDPIAQVAAALSALPGAQSLRALPVATPTSMIALMPGEPLPHLAEQTSPDPAGPFAGHRVYYVHTVGSELVFDVECAFLARRLGIRCTSATALRVEIADADGVALGSLGPVHGGERAGQLTVAFAPRSRLRVRITNQAPWQFAIEAITVSP